MKEWIEFGRFEVKSRKQELTVVLTLADGRVEKSFWILLCCYGCGSVECQIVI